MKTERRLRPGLNRLNTPPLRNLGLLYLLLHARPLLNPSLNNKNQYLLPSKPRACLHRLNNSPTLSNRLPTPSPLRPCKIKDRSRTSHTTNSVVMARLAVSQKPLRLPRSHTIPLANRSRSRTNTTTLDNRVRRRHSLALSLPHPTTSLLSISHLSSARSTRITMEVTASRTTRKANKKPVMLNSVLVVVLVQDLMTLAICGVRNNNK